MRKYIFSLYLFATIGVLAQETTMRDVFRQMPDTIVPYLTENNRLDFIDFIDSHMEAKVTNSFGGKSMMHMLTNQYAMLQLSEASSIQMRLLPVDTPVDSAKHIICMVKNYGKDIRESVICFYSLKWRQLSTNGYLNRPAKYKIYEAKLSEIEDELTLTPVSYLDIPANEEQEPDNTLSIKLKWNGKFVNYV